MRITVEGSYIRVDGDTVARIEKDAIASTRERFVSALRKLDDLTTIMPSLDLTARDFIDEVKKLRKIMERED